MGAFSQFLQKNTKTNFGSFLQKHSSTESKPAPTLPNLSTSNSTPAFNDTSVSSGVKEGTKVLGSFAKEVAQGTARTVGTVGITAANTAAKTVGAEQPFASEIDPNGNRISRAVFGDETIKDLPTYGKAGLDFLRKHGVNLPDYAALPLGVLGVVADLSGTGKPTREAAEAAFKKALDEGTDPTVSALTLFDNGKGNIVIDPDKLKLVTGEKTQATHEKYSQIAKQTFAQALEVDPNPEVHFLAGGSGSGKTETVLKMLSNDPSVKGIIYDGTLADYDSALSKFKQVEAADKTPVIDAVLPDIERAWKFQQSRAIRTGREVPLDIFVQTHVGVVNTLRRLASEGYDVRLLDTRNVRSKAQLEQTPKLSNPQDVLAVLDDVSYDANELLTRLPNVKLSEKQHRKALVRAEEARRALGGGDSGDGVQRDLLRGGGDLPRIERRIIDDTPEFGSAGKLDEIRSRTRGVISDEEAQKVAHTLGYTEERVLRIPLGKSLNKEEVLAVQGVTKNAVDTLKQMEGQLATLAKDSASYRNLRNEYALQKMKVVKLHAVERGVAAEAGRALQVHKATAEAIGKEEQYFAKLLNDPDVPQDVKDLITQKVGEFADEPEKLRDVLRSLHQASLMEMFVEFATAIKLYGIPTHLVNTISSATRLLLNLPIRTVSAGLDSLESVLRGRPRERFLTDVKAEAIGQYMGFRDSWRHALNALKDENYVNTMKQMQDFNPRGPAIKGRFGKDTAFDRALDVFGKGVRSSFRLLGAEDLLIRGPARMGVLYTEASRRAIKAGFEPGTKEFDEFFAKQIFEPDAKMLEDAEKGADIVLFQDELHPVLNKINEVRHAWPVTKLVIPFFKTLNNLIKQGFEFSALAPILPSVRGALKTPGARSDALAKMAIGTSITLPLTMYALEDNITLGAPKNPIERDEFFAEGKQAYSVKIGDKWYPFARFSPYSEWFVTAGLMAEAVKNEDEEAFSQRLANAFFTLTQNYMDKSFVSGLNDFLEATTDPNKADKWLQNFVTGATIPTIVSGAARAIDPTFREVNNIKEAYMSKIPGLSDNLDSRVDVFGEDVLRPGTGVQRFLSPVVPSQVQVDVVRSELKDIGVSVGFPSQQAFGFEVSDEAYRDIKVASGKIIYSTLFKIMQTPEYQNLDAKDKERLVNKVVDRSREAARVKYATENLIMSRIKDRLKDRGLSNEQAEEQAVKVYEFIKTQNGTASPEAQE